ncbi:MAG: hypothetical protein CVV28_02965 [Methanobacteriales archaeon HGW-Methanobacteriales-1]|nr:MAG: hypothetical protein CVV28_02965 [Methanobacteriales archaeon HGW-Methanobacteriales-1]
MIMKRIPNKIKIGQSKLYMALGVIYIAIGIQEINKEVYMGIILIFLGIAYIMESFNQID